MPNVDLQKYANALNATSAIDQDTIHLLFPGLSKLLDFQRRFLIKLEGVAELPWKEQRWGLHFIENVSVSASSLLLQSAKCTFCFHRAPIPVLPWHYHYRM